LRFVVEKGLYKAGLNSLLDRTNTTLITLPSSCPAGVMKSLATQLRPRFLMSIQFQDLKSKQSALSYILKQLRNEGTLSALISRRVHVDALGISTLLPQGIDEKVLYDFDYGGICGSTGANEFLVKYVLGFLNSNEGSCFIVEDTLVGPSDVFLGKTSARHFTCLQKVYFFAAGLNIQREELDNILKAAHRYPFLSYLCRVTTNIKERMINGIIRAEDLQLLSENTLEVFVGACDEETYLRIQFA